MKICHTYILKWKRLQSVLSLITPGCYLASLDLRDEYYSEPIYPDHISKIYLEKSIVKVFSTSKRSMLWPKKIYKINETTHSYLKIRCSYYCNLYWWPNKCWAHIWWMCRKCHSINKAFELTWVYYPSR